MKSALFFVCLLLGHLAFAGDTTGLSGDYQKQTVPRLVYPGKPMFISLEFKNTGTETWSADTIRLTAENPVVFKTWKAERILLVGKRSVPPGMTGTFTAQVLSPTQVGTHPFQWQLVDE